MNRRRLLPALLLAVGLLPLNAAQAVGTGVVLFNTVHRQSDGTVNGAVVRYGTGVPLGPAPWPMFRQNPRGNSHVDDLVAPSPTRVSAVAQSASRAVVTLTASDAGLGVAAFDVYYRDNGGPLVHWLPRTAPTSRDGTSATHTRALATTPGHSYRLQARAQDRDGNWGPWGATTYVAPTA